MKELIIASMIATAPITVGDGTIIKYTGQRENNAVVHVQNWDSLICQDKAKIPVIRIFSDVKTVSVMCE